MTEKEYIKCLNEAYQLTKKEIKEDLSECKRMAEEQGVSVEEVYEDLASIYKPLVTIKSNIITYDNDGNYLKSPEDFMSPNGTDADQEG